ncbi:Lipid A biosynthesis lauroyl acyltransferase [Lunatimonas lonarensis]|uniref:Lipid A biosynthesis lauroyl acyltransferase n=1 Tax=Lunatimonas lonarensis TaxID=1232681 RepID=R7ZXI5_9BACT|nr:lysophospholipid acyltransferase family protein [Lunatimonas lonarensis]EON78782.1 Lipid A biosynthesis lauroyl acyltransferase [Lunatimonas lonarensis]
MLFFKALSLLPTGVLYLISDCFYLIAYYLIGYRKRVVRENLAYAFPEKTKVQRKAIEKIFFRNLTDSFVETIKLLTLSESEIDKRYKLVNPELVTDRVRQGEVIIGVQAHFFNWEGHVVAMNRQLNKACETVYLKVSNPVFELLMRSIRSRFGGSLVERNSFIKHLIANRNTPRMIGLAADQRPQFSESRYWATFMNREAPFFEGAEKMAKKFSSPVIYGEIEKTKRGHYRYTYHLLASPPYKDTAPHSITDAYIAAVEANIRKNPSIYLWSHNRWKEKKSTGNSTFEPEPDKSGLRTG